MPTSITTAPGLTMSRVISPTRPTAATRMSACRVCIPRSGVREWQTVTVALAFSIMAASGLPTMLLRPTITACRPATATPSRLSSSMTPAGVQAPSVG